MLEPKICLACGSPVNPLPPVKANSFEESYPPKSWEVNCPNCGTATVILRSDLPDDLVKELQESRNGWDNVDEENSNGRRNNVDPTDDQYESDLSPLDLDDLFGDEPVKSEGLPIEVTYPAETDPADTELQEYSLQDDDSDELLFADDSELIPEDSDDLTSQSNDPEEPFVSKISEQPVDPSIIDDLFVDDPESAESQFSNNSQEFSEPNEEEADSGSFQATWRADDETTSRPDGDEEESWNPHSQESSSDSVNESTNSWSNQDEDPLAYLEEEDASAAETPVSENDDWQSRFSSEDDLQGGSSPQSEWEQIDDSQSIVEDFSEEPENTLSDGGVTPATPLPGEWDKGANEKLLKSKKEPSLLRKILPPILGAGAAIPIALGILWYGFGKDLGGIGATVAQYVPAAVPKHLHGNASRPAPYLPPPSTLPAFPNTEPVEATDITELGLPEQPTEIVVEEQLNESSTPSIDPAIASDPVVPSAPDSPTNFTAQVQGRVRSLLTAQSEFLTVGAANPSQRIPLANNFWQQVQNLGFEVNQIAESELSKDPSGPQAIHQLLSRDIQEWGRSAIDDSKISKLVERCGKGFNGLVDIGAPNVLVENLHYPDEIDVDYAFESVVKYDGKPIEIHIPGAILQAIGKPDSGASKTLLIGRTVETPNGYQFLVTFGMR